MVAIEPKKASQEGRTRSPSEALGNTILIGPIHTSELVLYQNCTKELVQKKGSYCNFLSPSRSKNGFSAQQPEQTGRLSPGIVVVLFGSGLGRMPGDLEKDR